MFRPKPLSAAALAALIALPAAAQTRPSLWDILHPDTLAERIIVGLMPSLRIFAEIRYEHLDIDFAATRLSVTGLTVASIPQLPGCRLTVDRLVLSGAPVDDIETYRGIADAAGLTFTPECGGPDAAEPLALIAPEGIAVDRAHIAMVYSGPTGAATMTLDLDAPELAAIEVTADFDYLSVMSIPREPPSFGEEPMPFLRLESALVRIEDRGLYQALGPLLPAEANDPVQMRLMAATGVMGGLMEMNGDGRVTPEQSQFANDFGTAFSALLEDGTPLVVETAAAEVVQIDPETLERPGEIFAALAPRIVTRPTPPAPLLAADLLSQALDPGARDDLGEEDRRKIALALATGRGAPQAPALALDVLGDAPATPALDLALARALAASDPGAAYSRALSAAATGEAGALGLLDSLEADLPAETYVALQTAAAAPPEDADFATPRALREAAFARMTGTRAPRDYAGAYYFATLAAATGDRSAEALIDQIDEMIRLSGDGTFWLGRREEIRTAALNEWVARDLASAFGG